jgi:hypothetical protein
MSEPQQVLLIAFTLGVTAERRAVHPSVWHLEGWHWQHGRLADITWDFHVTHWATGRAAEFGKS